MKAFLVVIKNTVEVEGGFGIRQVAAAGAVRSCPHISKALLIAAMGQGAPLLS